MTGQAERARLLGTGLEAGFGPTADHAWVWVSLVPDVPGEMLMNSAMLTALRTELARSAFPSIMMSNYSWYNVSVAMRRLLLSGSPDKGPPRWLAAELHGDGSGVFAMNAIQIGRGWHGPEDDSGRRVLLHDEQAVNAIMSGLRFLARHARDRCGAAGDASICARIPVDREGRIMFLGNGGRNFEDDGIGHPTGIPHEIAEAAAPLDSLADGGPGPISAACLPATDLFQQFGLPEVPQATRDGELRRPYWTPALFQQVEAWAN
jgi:hypothetical protein